MRPLVIVLGMFVVLAGLDDIIHPDPIPDVPPISQDVADLTALTEEIGAGALSCRVLCEPYAVKQGPVWNHSDDCVCSDRRLVDDNLIIRPVLTRAPSSGTHTAPAAQATQ